MIWKNHNKDYFWQNPLLPKLSAREIFLRCGISILSILFFVIFLSSVVWRNREKVEIINKRALFTWQKWKYVLPRLFCKGTNRLCQQTTEYEQFFSFRDCPFHWTALKELSLIFYKEDNRNRALILLKCVITLKEVFAYHSYFLENCVTYTVQDTCIKKSKLWISLQILFFLAYTNWFLGMNQFWKIQWFALRINKVLLI